MNSDIREKLSVAYEKANKVIEMLHSEDYGCLVSVEELVDIAKKISGLKKIVIASESFSRTTSLCEYANDFSMLRIEDDEARIVVNSDLDEHMRRFAAAHEIGHILIGQNVNSGRCVTDGGYIVSKHVNSNIEQLMPMIDNDYILSEELANIFAVLVLVHVDVNIREIETYGMESLASKFGVNDKAILSKVALSWLYA